MYLHKSKLAKHGQLQIVSRDCQEELICSANCRFTNLTLKTTKDLYFNNGVRHRIGMLSGRGL